MRQALQMESAPLLLVPHELKARVPDVALVGQKARGLAELLAFQSRVPRFCVLTADAFSAHIQDPRMRDVVQAAQTEKNPDALFCASTAEILVAAVTAHDLPRQVDAALDEMLERFPPGERLAVRASPVLDDTRHAAYAGAFETFLYVRDKDALAEAVKRVFASAFGHRAAEAALTVGDLPFQTPMAVVVQRMVDADKSGVAHSIDPDGRVGDPERYVIHATLGVAGGMAMATGPRDTIHIRRDQKNEIERTVRKKTERVRFDDNRGQGTRILPIDDVSVQEAPALDAYQTEKIVAELIRLEEAMTGNVIVEFAFSGRLLHTLQLTPQFLPERRVPGRRARRFDERLLPDGWAGYLDPVSFGVFHSAYLPAMAQAVRLLGADDKSLKGRNKARGRLLGYVGGRTFAHVGAHRAFLEALGEGVLLGEGLERVTGAAGLVPAPAEGPPDNDADAFLRMVRHEKNVTAEVEATLNDCRDRLNEIRVAAERDVDPDDIADRLDELAAVLCRALTSDIAARILQAGLFHATERMGDAWLDAPRPGLVYDLLGGGAEGQTPHRLDVSALVELAESIPVVTELFRRETDDEELLARLEGLPAATPFTDAFSAVLRQHQDTRLLSPAKLETPSLAERPDVLLWRVRVGMKQRPEHHHAERADGLRKKAEHLTETTLSDRRMRLLRHSRKKVFSQTLAALRATSVATEQLSPLLHDIYGVMRRLVARAGVRLFEHQLIRRANDVYTLSFAEVRGLIRGTVIDTDAAQTVAARTRARRLHPALTPPAMTTVGVLAAFRFDAKTARNHIRDEGGIERYGRGVSAGHATAPVFVVPHDPYGASADRDRVQPPARRSIWVVHQLDSGLGVHLDGVAGIIAERGSELSVAAQLCRRRGIPCVVGAEGARAFFAEHPLAEIDGRRGRYVRYDSEAQAYEDTSEFAHPDDFTKNAAPTDPTQKAFRMPPAQAAAPAPTTPPPLDELPNDLDGEKTEAFDYGDDR